MARQYHASTRSSFRIMYVSTRFSWCGNGILSFLWKRLSLVVGHVGTIHVFFMTMGFIVIDLELCRDGLCWQMVTKLVIPDKLV